MIKGYTVNRKPIRHNGKRYLEKEFISESELTEQQATRLLTMNAITKATKEEEETVSVLDSGSSSNSGHQTQDEEPVEVTLDINFEYQELVDGANEKELDFKGNISKKALIELIIKTENAQFFLDQLED
ncbi:hypothetical protein MKZ20_17555 [Psychrobacillus sp. FSL K6-2684]|uniref:hypothetical protein n=1 Tax=Psychrobacillus sp. FSL K6-2684 TaxID=2921547 RepID=UPI0030FC86CC